MCSTSAGTSADPEPVSTNWQSALAMSPASAAPRRTGLRPTGTIPDSAPATSVAEKNGVFCSNTPTCGGRAGSGVPAALRRCGTVPDVVAPTGERVLEIDAPIVDFG